MKKILPAVLFLWMFTSARAQQADTIYSDFYFGDTLQQYFPPATVTDSLPHDIYIGDTIPQPFGVTYESNFETYIAFRLKNGKWENFLIQADYPFFIREINFDKPVKLEKKGLPALLFTTHYQDGRSGTEEGFMEESDGTFLFDPEKKKIIFIQLTRYIHGDWFNIFAEDTTGQIPLDEREIIGVNVNYGYAGCKVIFNNGEITLIAQDFIPAAEIDTPAIIDKTPLVYEYKKGFFVRKK